MSVFIGTSCTQHTNPSDDAQGSGREREPPGDEEGQRENKERILWKRVPLEGSRKIRKKVLFLSVYGVLKIRFFSSKYLLLVTPSKYERKVQYLSDCPTGLLNLRA